MFPSPTAAAETGLVVRNGQEQYSEDWVEDTIPLASILPQYTNQEHYTVFNLLHHGNVQGLSSNKEGDRTCVDISSELLNFFPAEDGENMKDYAVRVLGFGLDSLTEQQQQARDKMVSIQMEKEWKLMHGYHYDKFSVESSKGGAGFTSSTLRRTASEEQDHTFPKKIKS